MKINIKGNAVTPDRIAEALKTCEKDYNLKIKNATLYVRFENDYGQTVEPLQDGSEMVRDFIFRKVKEVEIPQPAPAPEPPEPADPIPAKDMIELCSRRIGRMLSSTEMRILILLAEDTKVDKTVFSRCLEETMLRNVQQKIYYFDKIVRQQYSGKK